MLGLFKSVVFWILLIFLGGITTLFFIGNSFTEEDTLLPSTQQVAQTIPSVDALLVQVDEATGNRRILQCTESGCAPILPPASVGVNPLSDGTSWYRYAEHEDEKNKTPVTVLEKVDNTGNVQTITEENPLVKPRAMILSTDGTKIAYFLDNIHDSKGLTELWVYDSKEGGAKVIAEKLYRKDIATKVRWNASSQITWFLQEAKSANLIISSLGGGTGKLAFAGVDWNKYRDVVNAGVMDINDDMSRIAFAEHGAHGFSDFFVARGNEPAISKRVLGNIVFVRWMEHDALLYAIQSGTSLTFWMKNATKEWPIARMDAVFESAHSPGSSGLTAFVASPKLGEKHLYVLQLATGLLKDEIRVPSFPGITYVVQTRESTKSTDQAVTGATSTIPDGEIVAFIEEHARAITENSSAKPTRLLITDIPSTSFVDYTDSTGAEQRILVTVVGTANPEWKVVARYKTINGVWDRVDSSGNKEPKVLRLYEWEEQVSQWILKQEY
ncbi:MAG: hypothetical protein O3A36_01640 [bacterium]|nr:hypothetical protein [bacterium]